MNYTFKNSFDNQLNIDATSWAAIDMICSAFANLNSAFYDKVTKQTIKDYFLNDLIQNPNYDETKFTFFYNSAKDYFNGNVYYYKYTNDQNEVVALFRLNPSDVKVIKNTFNQKIYQHKGQEYAYDKILHIPSRYGYNGLVGKSIFNECKSIFNITSELDNYLNASFNNNVGNRLIIDISEQYKDPTEEQIQQLRNMFIQNYAGIKNAGKPLIKSDKIKYEKIETDYKDNKANQLIENRQFQEREISKLFGIPLALLTGGEKETNIEYLYILFIENAIKPVATQFQESINKLIPLSERSKIYFEYNYNSLLKTSLTTRIDTYSKQLAAGILSPNEIRRKENMNEIEAGDTHFVPANYLPLTQSIIDSYMANSKLKLKELNETSPNTVGKHDSKGDDKQ